LVAVAVLLAIAAATALGLSPQARAVVAERLGLGGIGIRHAPLSPPPAADLVPSLGRPVTLAAARRAVAFQVVVPPEAAAGPPAAVYLDESVAGGQVTFVYRGGGGDGLVAGSWLLLMQFQGSMRDDIAAKALGPGTTLEPVDIGGARGYWIAGQSHAFFYLDRRGQMRRETVRLAGNVLLWTRGDLTLRLEGVATKEAALRLARSIG
jgi:hypothetical protein